MINGVELNIDYVKLMGEEWVNFFGELLHTKEFYETMLELHKMYNRKTVKIYPDKHDIFRAFKLCHPDNLKIVIMGQQPYNDSYSNGLAFGIKEDSMKVPIGLNNIAKTVEKTCYKGMNIDFDYTLETWAEQGVLLLNRCFTSSANITPQYLLWRRISEQMFSHIEKNKSGIIFMLWGGFAQQVATRINTNFNHVMIAKNPNSVFPKDEWKCDHFEKANEILWENNDNMQECIIW